MMYFRKGKIKALLIGFVVAKLLITGYYLAGKFNPAAVLVQGIPAPAEAQAENGDESKPEADAGVDGAENGLEEEEPLLQPEDLRAVMESLEDKRLALEDEEERLKKERVRLDSLKQEIEEKILEMSAVQRKIEADLDKKTALAKQQAEKKDAAEVAKIKQLVKVYASMKPKNAAAIVDKMDLNVVLQVFSNMKGEQVGKILTYVNQDRAAKISERLATKDVK